MNTVCSLGLAQTWTVNCLQNGIGMVFIYSTKMSLIGTESTTHNSNVENLKRSFKIFSGVAENFPQ